MFSNEVPKSRMQLCIQAVSNFQNKKEVYDNLMRIHMSEERIEMIESKKLNVLFYILIMHIIIVISG